MLPAARTRANAVYYGFIVLSIGLIVTVSVCGSAPLVLCLDMRSPVLLELYFHLWRRTLQHPEALLSCRLAVQIVIIMHESQQWRKLVREEGELWRDLSREIVHDIGFI